MTTRDTDLQIATWYNRVPSTVKNKRRAIVPYTTAAVKLFEPLLPLLHGLYACVSMAKTLADA